VAEGGNNISGSNILIADIIAKLPGEYVKGSFPKKTVFYFSVDGVEKTVVLDANDCTVHAGKLSAEADCVCKTSGEMFTRIWNDGYRPGIMDFMSGKIKSNEPMLLPQFLKAFGK
jgi:putative sterol carrier protein